MFKKLFPSLEGVNDQSPTDPGYINLQRAFWISIIFTAVAVISMGLGIYLAISYPFWQIYMILIIATLSVVFDVLATVMIRRGRAEPGMKILYWSFLFVLPANTFLVPGIGPVLAAMTLVVGFVNIFMLFPRAWRRLTPIGPIASALITLLVEYLNPPFRYRVGILPTANFFGPFILGFLIIAILVLIIRQAIIGNIRNKLSTAFMVIAIVSVIAVAYPTDRTWVSTLTTSIGNNLSELASARSVDIGRTIDSEFKVLQALALNKVVQDAAAVANQGIPLSQAEIDRLDQQWRAADAANNDADPLVVGVLNNQAASELREFRSQFPQQVELFITGIQGVSIASTNRTSDYWQADEEWWQTAYRDGLYIGQPEYDDSSKTIAMNMAVAIRQNGRIAGVLRTTVNFTALTDTLIAGLFGETGRTNIYLPDGSELKLNATGNGSYDLVQQEAPPDFQTLARSTQKYLTISIDGVPAVASNASVTLPGNTGADAEIINNLNWRVVTLQDQAEAQKPIAAQTRNTTILALVLVTLVALAGRYLANLISSPIVRLTEIAGKVATGDLTAEAKVETRDEVGTLAATFNSMISQLRNLIGTLEQRVADRTKALATSTEVSRRLSTILNRKELVGEVVNQVNNAFGYYHTQIYFYNEARNNLIMAGGTGEAGEMMLAQFHKVAKGRGLVGRAADTNQAVLVADTSKNPEWLPNPLLPATRSEAAIPISIGAEVLGVLDVQQNMVNGLQKEDVDSLQSIANQVAVALQNIQSTEGVAKRAAELQTVAAISTSAATIGDVQKMLETVVHLTQRGFGLYHAHIFIYTEDTKRLEIAACGWKAGDEHAGAHDITIVSLEQEQSLVARAARTRQAVIVNDVHNEPGWLPNPLLPDTLAELAAPMIVGDQLLGVLDVQADRLNAFTEEDANIQTTLATQVATALQNARSFTEAQSQAERETVLNLITQKIQSATSIETALQIAARELGHALGGKPTRVALGPAAPAGEPKADS